MKHRRYTYCKKKLLVARPVLVLSTDLERPRTLCHHKIDRDNCLNQASKVMYNVEVNMRDDDRVDPEEVGPPLASLKFA